MKIDLHVHSKYSFDCKLELSLILKYAEKLGLDGIAIVDHGTMKGGEKAKKISKNIEIIVGAEILTDRGEVIGYFLNEEIKTRNFLDVCDEIKAQDGIVVLPHPFDIFRHGVKPSEKDVEFIDGVEVLNSRCLLSKFNKKAQKFAFKHELIATAGSDAHTLEEIGHAGIIVDSIEDIRKGNVRIFGGRTGILGLTKAKVKKIFI